MVKMWAVEKLCVALVCTSVVSVDGSCGECDVHTLSGFEDKRVTDHVMWTDQNTSTRAECVARCGQDELSEMCGYNPNSGVCVAYNATFTDPSNITFDVDSGYRMYSLCKASLPHFGACTSTCSGTNVVCNDGFCVCDIMYVKLGTSCVQDCGASGYGSHFTTFHNKVINGYNDKTVYSIETIEACMSLCLAETDFVCVTADYKHGSERCFLSQTAWYDAPSSSAVNSTTYHQIIRNCA